MAEKKKPIKIGINGFGKTGRSVARAILERNDVKLVAINEPCKSIEEMIYKFKYDSVHGPWNGSLRSRSIYGMNLIVFGLERVHITNHREPDLISWDSSGLHADGVDVVVDCFSTSKKEAALHLKGCSMKVIIAAPTEDAPMFVFGVNEHQYKSDIDILCCANSTSNCLAPLAKVINDRFGIVEGFVTAVRSANGTQKTLGDPSVTGLRGGRPFYMNIIPLPLETCAAEAVGKLIPSLKGKLAGTSFFVPTSGGTALDLTVKLHKAATYDEIKLAIKEESEGKMKGILGYTEDDLVSRDIMGDTRSSIFDATAGLALNKEFVKLVSWHDERSGLSSRLIDMAAFIPLPSSMVLAHLDCNVSAEVVKPYDARRTTVNLRYKKSREVVSVTPSGHEVIKTYALTYRVVDMKFFVSPHRDLGSILRKDVLKVNSWVLRRLSDMIRSKAAQVVKKGEFYNVNIQIGVVFQRRLSQMGLNGLEEEDEKEKEKKEKEGGVDCGICLGSFHNQKNCRKIQCGHSFHRACILEWHRKHEDCPICRLTSPSYRCF